MSSSENFLDSVNKMFDQSAALLNLSNGLAEKIKVANSTYTVRFGVRLRDKLETFTGNLKPLLGSDLFIQNIGNQ